MKTDVFTSRKVIIWQFVAKSVMKKCCSILLWLKLVFHYSFNNNALPSTASKIKFSEVSY